MHKRPVELFVIDIMLAAHTLNKYSSTVLTYDDFLIDKHNQFNGAMYCFVVISEALQHILEEETMSALAQREWRFIIGFRNILVHHYFGLDLEEVYQIIKEDFPVFEQEFLSFVGKIRNEPMFILALHKAIDEQKNHKKYQLQKYLEKFRDEHVQLKLL